MLITNRCFSVIPILLLGLGFEFVSSATYNCARNATCGCSAQPAILNKIVGGEEASGETWGWAVSIRSEPSGSHFCGGTIISDWHILTAAHCTIDIRSLSSISVRIGSIFLSSGGQTRTISRIYNHPSYSSLTKAHDIAILKLSSPLNLDQVAVDRICLPNVPPSVLAAGEYPRASINLVAIGWGVTVESSKIPASRLRQVTVQSVGISSNYCRAILSSSVNRFCAGVMPMGGKDTCQGDSGGPLLMFTDNNIWEQVGITSIGQGCARPNLPGIYTRVAAYQAWINATLNSAHKVSMMSYAVLAPVLLLLST